MATLRPLVKPKIIRKRTKSSSGTSQTDMSKLSVTGGNPEALTIVYTEDSGRIPMPSIGDRIAKKTVCAASGFRKFLVHSIKELEVLLMGKTLLC